MSTFWDFRAILDVHPELRPFRCVAFNQGSLKRCGIEENLIGHVALQEARDILDTMDRTVSVTECRTYLNQLAINTMCTKPHRPMINIREDRVRRWNTTISDYVALEAHNQQEALQPEKVEEIAVVLNTQAQNRHSIAESQEQAHDHAFATHSAASKAKKLESRPVNPSIITNETTPKPETQINESTCHITDAIAKHTPADDANPQISDSRLLTGSENHTKISLTTQHYGLPSPPNSMLETSITHQHAYVHPQSPPETPTKGQVSRSEAESNSEQSEAVVTSTQLTSVTEGKKPVVQFGKAGESSRLDFDFNSMIKGSDLGHSSANPGSSQQPFAFGSKGQAAKKINFQFNSEAKTSTEVSLSSKKPSSEDSLEQKAQFQIANITSGIPSDPFTSELLEEPASNVGIVQIQKKVNESSAAVLEPSLSSTTVSGKQTSHPLSEVPESSSQLSAQTTSYQAEQEIPELQSSKPVNNTTLLDDLSQKPLPVFKADSFSISDDTTPSSSIESRPLFAFASETASTTENRRAESEPSNGHTAEPSANLISSASAHVFGSKYRVPPKSFDFNEWAKLSSSVWTSTKHLTMWDHLKGDMESSNSRVETAKSDKTASINTTDDDELLSRETSIEETKILPEEEDTTVHEESKGGEKVPNPLDSPQEINVSQFESSSTLEPIPEPSQDEKAINTCIEESTSTATETPQQTITNEDETPIVCDTALNPLLEGDKTTSLADKEDSYVSLGHIRHGHTLPEATTEPIEDSFASSAPENHKNSPEPQFSSSESDGKAPFTLVIEENATSPSSNEMEIAPEPKIGDLPKMSKGGRIDSFGCATIGSTEIQSQTHLSELHVSSTTKTREEEAGSWAIGMDDEDSFAKINDIEPLAAPVEHKPLLLPRKRPGRKPVAPASASRKGKEIAGDREQQKEQIEWENDRGGNSSKSGRKRTLRSSYDKVKNEMKNVMYETYEQVRRRSGRVSRSSVPVD